MSFGKYRVIVWKNWRIQRRHYISGILEMILPVLIVIIVTWIKSESEKGNTKGIDKIDTRNYRFLPISLCVRPFSKIYYSPKSAWADDFLASTFDKNLSQLVSFDNAQALDEFLINENEPGIEFDDSLRDAIEPPNVFRYKLRLLNQLSNRYTSIPDCFIEIQKQLDRSFIGIFNKAAIPEFNLTSFSYHNTLSSDLDHWFKIIVPLLLVLSTFYTASKIVKNVAVERESQLKEAMRIMGLSNALHWTAWLTSSFLIPVTAYTLVTIILCFKIVDGKAIFGHSNFFLIWLFFVFYIIAAITFCFLISVIFKAASTAGKMGSLIFILTYVFHNQFGENFESFSYVVKLLFCLPINTGLGQGISMVLQLEKDGTGLQFSNFASHDNLLRFSIVDVIFSFVIASIIYMLLTVYIEQVFTGSIGVPKPWYFPFTMVVELFGKQSSVNDDDCDVKEQPKLSLQDYEKDPQNLKVGIEIVELTKKFGKSTVVNQLSLNMYEDQITVLLGHNGCGKTTTLNMLTGMFAPTSGTAFLNRHDIRSEIDEARKSLGLCPQHNILFDDLTVREHFVFFCRLKGVHSKESIDNEISKYVNLLDFNDKIDALSKTLSGGQKRKLSIGVALVGGSKIVMLDEPTSGLDAGARRSLWNLLMAEKKGRTILLTTHYMDEADILGDRIAIMNNGELQTVGSSFFLKKRFGSGYKLICVKRKGCNPNHISNVLQNFVPDARLESDTETEAVFILNEDNLPIFPQMFRKIEELSNSLQISSFGLSLTTLEEVFIKVGSDKSSSDQPHSQFIDFAPSRRVTGFALALYQIYAMFLKTVHLTRRNLYPIGWSILVTVAIMYTLLAIPYESLNNRDRTIPESIALSSFNATVTGVSHDGSYPSLFENYISLFQGKDVVEEVNSFEDYMLEKYHTSEQSVYKRNLIGLSLKSGKITAWFQSDRFYEILSLNTIHRAMLKSVAKKYDIMVSMKPLTVSSSTATTEFFLNKYGTSKMQDEDELSTDARGTNFSLIFAMFYLLCCYWPSIFITIKIKERTTRAKLLQFISGANRIIYWSASFFIDYILLLVVMYIMLGIVALNQRPDLQTFDQLKTLMVIFLSYGFSAVSFLYMASFLFAKHATAEVMVPLYGILCAIIYGIYAFFNKLLKWDRLANMIYWPMMLLAPFSLFDCFVKIMKSQLLDQLPHQDSDQGKQLVDVNIMLMIASGILFLSICILLDNFVFEKLIAKIKFNGIKLPTTNATTTVDSDVADEIEKIKRMSNYELKEANLVLQGLTKFYGKNLAVNQLYLGVNKSECFGLLGVNGAGKTSTFKMMTGDETISSGDVWIRGRSMKSNMLKAQHSIGYCPQFDALLFDISGRENLKIFSLLRGIPICEIDEIIEKISKEFGFHVHLDKKVKVYSGGNKRKLSAALSVLGDPDLIFLDEPTTGIDPYSKRLLWTVVNKIRFSGKSVILTSHSMEECEALCSRIAIMVAGQFKCLGSAQHLKSKFSEGYHLTVKMLHDDEPELLRIKDRVLELFPSAQLKEKYMDLITFNVPTVKSKWSEVFGTMSQLKSENAINDFTVTQMSLEQVFMYFTRDEGEKVGIVNGV